MGDVELLINEVKKRCSLWNNHRKIPNKRAFLNKRWEIVAYKCRLPIKTARNKWKNLKHRFKLELNKSLEKDSGDAVRILATYAGKWKHFQSLLFLKDNWTLNPKIESLDNTSEPLSDSDEMQSFEVELDELQPNEVEPDEGEPDEVEPDKAGPEGVEPDELFLGSLLPCFKLLSPTVNLEIRNQFQNILIKYLLISTILTEI
ncbi:hypothetical protein FQA39_LY02419 [Lamprigera yunnana]|nr:hypothetical protein FQA39_LY02419 [Lamprigera yunnana]